MVHCHQTLDRNEKLGLETRIVPEFGEGRRSTLRARAVHQSPPQPAIVELVEVEVATERGGLAVKRHPREQHDRQCRRVCCTAAEQHSRPAPLVHCPARRVENGPWMTSSYSSRLARCERSDTHRLRSRARWRSARARRRGLSGSLPSRVPQLLMQTRPAMRRGVGSTPAGAMGYRSRATMIGPAMLALPRKRATAASHSSWLHSLMGTVG